MFKLIIIISIVLLLVAASFIFLLMWLVESVDFDQDDRQLFCESYKAMATDNVEQSIDNPGKI